MVQREPEDQKKIRGSGTGGGDEGIEKVIGLLWELHCGGAGKEG